MWNRTAFWGDALVVRAENDTLKAAHNVPEWVKLLPLIVGLLGIATAYLFYMFKPGLPGRFKAAFRALHTLFYNKWFFDEIYDRLFVRTARCAGMIFWKRGDQNTIDRFGPDGAAKQSQKLSHLLSKFQSGYVFQYAFMMIIGLVAIISWFVFRAGA